MCFALQSSLPVEVLQDAYVPAVQGLALPEQSPIGMSVVDSSAVRDPTMTETAREHTSVSSSEAALVNDCCIMTDEKTRKGDGGRFFRSDNETTVNNLSSPNETPDVISTAGASTPDYRERETEIHLNNLSGFLQQTAGTGQVESEKSDLPPISGHHSDVEGQLVASNSHTPFGPTTDATMQCGQTAAWPHSATLVSEESHAMQLVDQMPDSTTLVDPVLPNQCSATPADVDEGASLFDQGQPKKAASMTSIGSTSMPAANHHGARPPHPASPGEISAQLGETPPSTSTMAIIVTAQESCDLEDSTPSSASTTPAHDTPSVGTLQPMSSTIAGEAPGHHVLPQRPQSSGYRPPSPSQAPTGATSNNFRRPTSSRNRDVQGSAALPDNEHATPDNPTAALSEEPTSLFLNSPFQPYAHSMRVRPEDCTSKATSRAGSSRQVEHLLPEYVRFSSSEEPDDLTSTEPDVRQQQYSHPVDTRVLSGSGSNVGVRSLYSHIQSDQKVNQAERRDSGEHRVHTERSADDHGAVGERPTQDIDRPAQSIGHPTQDIDRPTRDTTVADKSFHQSPLLQLRQRHLTPEEKTARPSPAEDQGKSTFDKLYVGFFFIHRHSHIKLMSSANHVGVGTPRK